MAFPIISSKYTKVFFQNLESLEYSRLSPSIKLSLIHILSVYDLHKGITLDWSDCTEFVGFCHRCGNDSFYISSLFTCHYIRCNIVRRSVRFCTDKFCSWISLCNVQCRIKMCIRDRGNPGSSCHCYKPMRVPVRR